MFLSLLAVTILLPVASEAAEPKLAWELAGFENPESVLFDGASKTLFVSNVAGDPLKKDGNGFICKVTPDGKLVTLKWVEGLNAPKGMALANGTLYVSDIDEVVAIDAASGKVAARHPAAGAKFLNDVAAAKDGSVFISDMATNTIWRLAGGKLESWLASADLRNPNGLLVEGDRLVVGAWGVMTDGFDTKVPGNLLAVSLGDKSIKNLGDGSPAGNLDGVEPLGGGAYLVTDWMAGKLLHIESTGKARVLVAPGSGSADLAYDAATRTAFIPMMKDNKLLAFVAGEKGFGQ